MSTTSVTDGGMFCDGSRLPPKQLTVLRFGFDSSIQGVALVVVVVVVVVWCG